MTHLHGAHAYEDSDGYPEAWYLPLAKNIPKGYASVGSKYYQYKEEAQARAGVAWTSRDGPVRVQQRPARHVALVSRPHPRDGPP